MQKLVGGIIAGVIALGGVGGGGAWWAQRSTSEQSEDKSDIAELRAANNKLANEIEDGKRKRLDVFEGRLGKIEKWQVRYGFVIDRIAEESLGADEAKKVRRAAARAAETVEDDR